MTQNFILHVPFLRNLLQDALQQNESINQEKRYGMQRAEALAQGRAKGLRLATEQSPAGPNPDRNRARRKRPRNKWSRSSVQS